MLKNKPQCNLNQPRVPGSVYLSEGRSSCDVPGWVKKLRVIKQIEELGAKFQICSLAQRYSFVESEIEVDNARAAAHGARRIADLAQGAVNERLGIEIVAAGCPWIQSAEWRDLVWLAGRFEIEAAHQLLIPGRRNPDWKSGLQRRDARHGPPVENVPAPVRNPPDWKLPVPA